MVVIVASLFLPFQPEFEFGDSNDVSGTKQNDPNDPSTDGTPTVKRSQSFHSLAATAGKQEKETDKSSTNNEGQKQGGVPAVLNPQFLMENLTATTSNSAVVTPVTPLYSLGNASVEEFFASGSVAKPKDNDGSSAVHSTVSSPSGELASGLHSGANSGGVDTTANLLKNVNKSLLYQSVLAGSRSMTALEGSKVIPSAASRSRQLLDVGKDKTPHTSLSAVRWNAQHKLGTPGVVTAHSSLKYPLTPDHQSPSNTEQDDALKSDDECDNIVVQHSGRRSPKVAKYGGYSDRAKLRAQLFNTKDMLKNVPWKIVPSIKGNGGLRNALGTAIIEKTIDQPVIWVGTVGIPTDNVPDEVMDDITVALKQNFHSRTVITDNVTFKGAYVNFCKQILWPTLNYQIPDNPNSKAFEDHSWNYYQHLNQQFADKIVETYQDGDTIWIHDYHLMLVPGMIRKKLPSAKIGFFLHVSFPSSEVFRCFAQRDNILEGMLGANSLGFQTEEYARHFQQTTNRLLMADVDTHLLKYKGRLIAVESIPIGIDALDLEAQIKSEATQEWRKLIRERWAGKQLIVCRDQFDRIRGLKKKMLAYEQFLKDNPEYIDKVVLIQICLGSGFDAELEREVMMIVDRVNALSNDISASPPVVVLHQDLQFPQYLALGCEADLFLITTMREGMNLTCHEFVICSQDKNAPLILSEFTGSAHVLSQGAFLINPWDIKQVSQVIKKALELSKEEKRRRWKQLFKSVITHDSDRWIVSSLTNIANTWEANNERSKVYNLTLSKIQDSYVKSKRHLFVLKISEPLNARSLAVLAELSSKHSVFVMNSFSRSVLERIYSRVPNIGLIAENGAFVRLNGTWYNLVDDISWKEDIVKVIEDKVERLPGSYYKEGETMIRFHSENAEDKDRVSNVIGDAITHVNTLFGDSGIHAYIHRDIMYVQQSGLAVRAMNFLLNQCNSAGCEPNASPDGSPLTSPVVNSIATLSSPSTSGSKTSSNSTTSYLSKNRPDRRVDFVAITGSSSPIIEPLFQLVNQSAKDGEIANCYTIAYGEAIKTYAKEHIQGLNELFGILDKLVKL
ncbi:HGR062Cp [Eremothecium sinecaudum]|uniref:HGR062Cp n=1 Tax=Eremothecium sinecaudum TaxID=45286 RepID=A0A0X8HVR7_9SACH|nr:HGR062Cp [Eremothecium sinecaudum]AMD22401.1 HGR062Cp [Eremothecium sinecaudum]